MITFAGRAILLDIEGTTSSIHYVHQVLFPFARQRLRSFLSGQSERADVRHSLELVARDAGHESLGEWIGSSTLAETLPAIEARLLAWMDQDAKRTGLKDLQGLIWREGYESGSLKSHVYADAPKAMRSWRERSITLAIYSSGSIGAQKLFFKHTEVGDLTPLLSYHFDTTTGAKRDVGSYRKIAALMGFEPSEILFLSDTQAEIEAALQAGMKAALVQRDGLTDGSRKRQGQLKSFDEIALID